MTLKQQRKERKNAMLKNEMKNTLNVHWAKFSYLGFDGALD